MFMLEKEYEKILEYKNLTTEMLIKYEKEIDWEYFSTVNRPISKFEIKVFGHLIHWFGYLMKNDLDEEKLEMAAKYFNPMTFYLLIAIQEKRVPDSIIEKYGHSLGLATWKHIFKKYSLSEDIIIKLSNSWSNIEISELKELIESNPFITEETHPNLYLYVNLKS